MRSNEKLRHARVQAQNQWQDFVAHREVHLDNPWLAQSWQVSANSVDVAQAGAPVDDPDHIRHQFIHSERYRASAPILHELQHTLLDSGYALGLTDADAQLQWTAPNRTMEKRLEKAHFVPSARWNEQSVGTNAVGVAARLGRASTVFSAEHYIASLHEWVCYAAPILHPISGRVLGVLDLSAPWQAATPMALATVSHYAQLIGHSWGGVDDEPSYCLGLCAGVSGDGRARMTLTRRLQEIFLTLSLHPEGLSLETLHALVYGDESVSLSTLKSEISHLRHAVGDVLQSRPYRIQTNPLTAPTDVQLIEQYAIGGRVDEMMVLYQKPLLPQSQSPAVVEYREYLHQLVIRALLKADATDALWQFILRHETDYQILHRLMQRLPACDGRRVAVAAKLTQCE